jgi:acyl-CoA reductase-like NAD-dependent aldehyde dehydrogenase
MFKLVDLIEKNHDELTHLEALDSGKPVEFARAADVPIMINTFKYYAGWADKIHGMTIPMNGPFVNHTRMEPVGVCG